MLVFDRAVESQTDAELAARASTALENLGHSGEANDQLGHTDAPLTLPDTIVMIVDPHGTITDANVPLAQAERSIAALVRSTSAPTFETITLGAQPVRVHTVPLPPGSDRGGTLVVGRSIAALEAARAQLTATLLLLLPAALVLASGGGYLLARRALRPVDELRRRADEIVDLADLDRRLAPGPRDDELGRLGRTLDRMLARIGRAVEQQRRFTADASHELRTPLAAILADASLALSRSRGAAEYRAALERAQSAAIRLAGIVDALLTISRADAGALSRNPSVTDLGEVAALAVERSADRAHELGAKIHLRSAPGAVVRGDADALGRVADNLIDNALRHGRRGGEVTVAVTRRGGRATLSVQDDGAGFPPDLLPEAFERFRRGAAAGGDGAGLGLAIVQAVVQAYGGRARAENLPGSGARVTVEIPSAR